ncbi:hypothetical protein B0H63DRAFT_470611 [Podospora didyma]|uniref:KOW domain-containing protein n=1 Tax=Podospora didyma TaxID=330526 RepID=A0AAE0U1Q9_9PEZI|nr:hypothetical protein B0H63DRAFT_470611 [Podospora didyma]
MDKLLRRVRMAEGQVARKAKRAAFIKHSQDKHARRRESIGLFQAAGHQLGAAIKARHENYEMGPLAPRRDVSRLDKNGNYWGSISPEQTLLQTTLTDEQKEARAAWCGGSKYLCLAKGDRVVVVEGPFKGKIAAIEEIKRDIMAVTLTNELQVNTKIPDFMVVPGQNPVELMASVIPISAVRLVHPLRDPTTKKIRDVIIKELKPDRIYHDRPTRKKTWYRVIPGLNTRIPWPRAEPKVYKDYPGDTLRIAVEERTFVPTLLRPPMPETVIDELRNRYSIFRTRHTSEYIAQKEAEEAEKIARKKSINTMLSPVQELNRQQREIRRARGQPELTEEMLEKIGQVILKNKLAREGGTSSMTRTDAEVSHIEAAVEQLTLDPTAQGTKAPEEQPRPL